jgi:hypothetical protein
MRDGEVMRAPAAVLMISVRCDSGTPPGGERAGRIVGAIAGQR